MIILVGNLKGGTGKSTIAFNMGVWSAYQTRKTLLIDADPLHTISNLIVVREEEEHTPSLYSIVAKEADIQKEVERTRDLFDDIIVDIAAGDKVGFEAALKVADKVIMPLLPGQADVWALHDGLDIVRNTKPEIEVMAVINKADTNPMIRETQETEAAIRQLEGITLAPTSIGYRVLMRRSLTEGLGVGEWAPRSRAASEINHLAQTVFADA